jgi:hypothetical protein
VNLTPLDVRCPTCEPRQENDVSLAAASRAQTHIVTVIDRSRLGSLHKEANRRDDNREYDYDLNQAR